MKRNVKEQINKILILMEEAHKSIKNELQDGDVNLVLQLLQDCQNSAINIGTTIEKTEGRDFSTIKLLEKYCEAVYQIYQKVEMEETLDSYKGYKKLETLFLPIKRSIKNEICVCIEIVFLPYKASMWGSFESIWEAAEKDPNCNAYVVPIPYYNRNSDGGFGAYHYEGSDFPENVPITFYESYNIEEREPDIIYIHNPYDHANYVTSIDPRYYSFELKKQTNLLIYVPYYSTSGEMAEGQSLCQAYVNADYIIVQAEKYIDFFDKIIPREKLLPLGSPKLDKIIRLSKTPPKTPENWEQNISEKKVYFYNTSIVGMLEDTKCFLMKMEYVFKSFQGRKDACLIWRPHPLLEATFNSLRKNYQSHYDKLKRLFMDENLGIYDDTAEVEKTIALCDAYIGDSGTSLTSLFGIVGKPLFILNNRIHNLPQDDDWRGEIIQGYFPDGHDKWRVTQGNKLYVSPQDDYQYVYYCDLSEYHAGKYYLRAMEFDGKIYACPKNAQDILIIENKKIIKKIQLEKKIAGREAFCNAWNIGEFLFLIPNKYPAIVRYNMRSERVDYITGCNDIFIEMINGEKKIGANYTWNNFLVLASPIDGILLMIDSETMKTQLLNTHAKTGCATIIPQKDIIWMLPMEGTTITCFNPNSGVRKEYTGVPPEFKYNSIPFSRAIFYDNKMILSPFSANMFLSLDLSNGKFEKWDVSLEMELIEKNGYYPVASIASFFGQQLLNICRFFYPSKRKIYEIDIRTKNMKEITISYDKNELINHAPGFGKNSEWLPYACEENAFNSLGDFLNGHITGEKFSKEKQIKEFQKISVDKDGTSGQKIHEFSLKQMGL